MRPVPEVFPFAAIDDSWRYPPWIRGLRTANGVYCFRERRSGDIVYVGESHSDRLYATLTRHFQAWTDVYRTAGATYARDEVDVAVIVVSAEHAVYLQNELICALIPRDNRLQCAQLFGLDADEVDALAADPRSATYGYDYDAIAEADGDEVYELEISGRDPPPDYDYDIPLLIQAIDHDFDTAAGDVDDGDDVPF